MGKAMKMRLDLGFFDTIEEARTFIKAEIEAGRIEAEPRPVIIDFRPGRFLVVGTCDVVLNDVCVLG